MINGRELEPPHGNLKIQARRRFVRLAFKRQPNFRIEIAVQKVQCIALETQAPGLVLPGSFAAKLVEMQRFGEQPPVLEDEILTVDPERAALLRTRGGCRQATDARQALGWTQGEITQRNVKREHPWRALRRHLEADGEGLDQPQRAQAREALALLRIDTGK